MKRRIALWFLDLFREEILDFFAENGLPTYWEVHDMIEEAKADIEADMQMEDLR